MPTTQRLRCCACLPVVPKGRASARLSSGLSCPESTAPMLRRLLRPAPPYLFVVAPKPLARLPAAPVLLYIPTAALARSHPSGLRNLANQTQFHRAGASAHNMTL